MNMKHQLESVFENKTFCWGCFYEYPGGLRFRLSEPDVGQGGSWVAQFLTAMSKALVICEDIFSEAEPITVGLETYADLTRFSDRRELLTQLELAGIQVPRPRSMWTTFHEDDAPNSFSIVFEAPTWLLPNLLWCAFATDLGIKPRPGCLVYLHSMSKRVMVHPYDDRGMDVVGPNHDFLAGLYRKHNALLLDYDRAAMQATFGPAPDQVPGDKNTRGWFGRFSRPV
jgi:hypothetical protein